MKKHKINFVPIAAKRLYPDENRVELDNGDSIAYDILVVATGPELAFDEVEGLGPNANTQSVCTVDHATAAYKKWEEFCEDPGPIVVGAAQGASCYGPAYEFCMIMDTDLKRRKIRHKVPMTFITAEPYIGHLGLGGVGDTKGMLESKLRDRDVKWITNSRIDKIEEGKLYTSEFTDDGEVAKTHEIDFKYSMILPAFRGIEAVRDIDGLTNPRGFILVDDNQRNPKYTNIYSVGVCIAIAPLETTPVPTGVPKTGFMIESMVTAVAKNIGQQLRGDEPSHNATWNAFCLADMGNEGIAFIAIPQNPPRNTNWSSQGKWVHLAKVAFERYFLRKVRKGITEPFYERTIMNLLKMYKLTHK
jgi:sulfide:quinone oxidoreductase